MQLSCEHRLRVCDCAKSACIVLHLKSESKNKGGSGIVAVNAVTGTRLHRTIASTDVAHKCASHPRTAANLTIPEIKSSV